MGYLLSLIRSIALLRLSFEGREGPHRSVSAPPRFTGSSRAASGAARGDFDGGGERGEGPSVSRRPGGMRSGWLKIHIEAGNWEKCLCGKRQQGTGWAARKVSRQLRERIVRSGDAPVALQPSPSRRSVSCGMGTSRLFAAPVLALHLLQSLL